MTDGVVRTHPETTVAAAARSLAGNNIGVLPVCGNDGTLLGVVTDRDLVVRCMATACSPEKMKIRQVMSGGVVCAAPDMEVSVAAALMGRKQIRRMPVVENGRLCGMVSLADIAGREETWADAADALAEIVENVT